MPTDTVSAAVLTVVLDLVAVGFLTMAVVQALKHSTRARPKFNRRTLNRELRVLKSTVSASESARREEIQAAVGVFLSRLGDGVMHMSSSQLSAQLSLLAKDLIQSPIENEGLLRVLAAGVESDPVSDLIGTERRRVAAESARREAQQHRREQRLQEDPSGDVPEEAPSLSALMLVENQVRRNLDNIHAALEFGWRSQMLLTATATASGLSGVLLVIVAFESSSLPRGWALFGLVVVALPLVWLVGGMAGSLAAVFYDLLVRRGRA